VPKEQSADLRGPAFALLLKRHRLAKHMTHEALAAAALISAQAVGALESGRRKGPQQRTVDALADALRLTGSDRKEFNDAAERGRAREPRRASADDIREPSGPNAQIFAQSSTFVGQARACGVVLALIKRSRKLTLTGPPGIGKTRLALEIARHHGIDRAAGTAFIECATHSNGLQIIDAIAAATGQRLSPEGDAISNLVDAIKSLDLLLVLDNCEHVIDDAAKIVVAIGLACPAITVMATSREVLGVEGERVYHVPALAVPPSNIYRVVDLLQYDAAALFVERAEAVGPLFDLDDQTVTAIVEVVNKLEGLPLAIELAAARTNQMSLKEIARQLDDRLPFLSWGRRDAAPRQRTLRALIDWSFGLLSKSERLLLQRSAAFSGGWSLEAARDVCCFDNELAPGEILDLFSSLVRKNLVVLTGRHGTIRYALLESVRTYALEKLEISGELLTVVKRHTEWFARFADSIGRNGTELQSNGQLRLAEVEIANVNAALDWAVTTDGQAVIAARIAVGFFRAWTFCGFRKHGLAALRKVLPLVSENESGLMVARIWLGIASTSFARAKVDAAREAVSRLEAVSEPALLISALIYLCEGLLDTGFLAEAEIAIERAYSACRSSGHTEEPKDVALLSVVLGLRAWIMSETERFIEARACYEDALEISRSIGNEYIEIGFKANLATLEIALGRHQEAIGLAMDARAQARRLRYAELELSLLTALVGYHAIVGDSASAYLAAGRALPIVRKLSQLSTAARIIQHVAAAAALRGEWPMSARLLGYAEAAYERIGYRRDSTETQTLALAQTLLSGALSAEVILQYRDEGRRLNDDDALKAVRDLALAFEP
jgi:predicted ATPase/transcriptional regulator with XRE-family HTH domain